MDSVSWVIVIFVVIGVFALAAFSPLWLPIVAGIFAAIT